MDIPTNIDLSKYSGAVAYQGDEGTCAENAEYNALLTQTNLIGAAFKIDRQFAYQTVLNLEGYPKADHGTVMPLLWQSGETTGLIADTGVYGAQYIGTQPTQAQYTDAQTHKIVSTSSLNIETQIHYVAVQIADMLNHDQPVILGFKLRQDFLNNTGSNTGTLLGGHAVAVDGYYVDANGHDILKVQSWGPQYGSNGYYKLDMTVSFAGTQMSDIISIDTINGFNGVNWSGDGNSLNIAELYNSILKRAPETSAFWNCSVAINSGTSLETLATNIFNSSECQALLPTSATSKQVVDYLYSTIQGRTPDAGGEAFWMSYLDGGGTRAHLAVQMIHDTQDSAEWAYNYFVGTNQTLRIASDWLYNHAVASIDLGLHMQDKGLDPVGAGLLTSVASKVTADPNSVQIALIGVNEALGHTVVSEYLAAAHLMGWA